MLKEDAKKLMQYAIDKANGLCGVGEISERSAWCDTIDCLGEALKSEFGIDLGVHVNNNNEYQLGE